MCLSVKSKSRLQRCTGHTSHLPALWPHSSGVFHPPFLIRLFRNCVFFCVFSQNLLKRFDTFEWKPDWCVARCFHLHKRRTTVGRRFISAVFLIIYLFIWRNYTFLYSWATSFWAPRSCWRRWRVVSGNLVDSHWISGLLTRQNEASQPWWWVREIVKKKNKIKIN